MPVAQRAAAGRIDRYNPPVVAVGAVTWNFEPGVEAVFLVEWKDETVGHGPVRMRSLGCRHDLIQREIGSCRPHELFGIHPFVDRLVEHQQAASEARQHEERAAQQADIEVQV